MALYDNRKSLPANTDPAQDCGHHDLTIKQHSRGDRYNTMTTCDDCGSESTAVSWPENPQFPR